MFGSANYWYVISDFGFGDEIVASFATKSKAKEAVRVCSEEDEMHDYWLGCSRTPGFFAFLYHELLGRIS